MSQYLAYRYGRFPHPPDALIEAVFGCRDGFHDFDGDSPGGRGPAFFVCSAPAPLRAPSRGPARRPDRDRASTSRTHARCTRATPRGHPLGRRAIPVVPQPGRTVVDTHTPTPKFRTDGTAHCLCKRCVALVVAYQRDLLSTEHSPALAHCHAASVAPCASSPHARLADARLRVALPEVTWGGRPWSGSRLSATSRCRVTKAGRCLVASGFAATLASVLTAQCVRSGRLVCKRVGRRRAGSAIPMDAEGRIACPDANVLADGRVNT